IGGGIVGSAIAYYMAESGRDCVLIEKNDIASGTSSKCDGNVTIVDKDPGFGSQLSLLSQALMIDLQQTLNLPFEFRVKGSTLVCANDDDRQADSERVQTQREAGLKFNVLSPEDIRKESPFFAHDIPGGLECETDSLINPYLFCYSLIEKARGFGLDVKTQSEVTNITRNEEDFTIETRKGN